MSTYKQKAMLRFVKCTSKAINSIILHIKKYTKSPSKVSLGLWQNGTDEKDLWSFLQLE